MSLGTTTAFSDITLRCEALGKVAEKKPRKYHAHKILAKCYKPRKIFHYQIIALRYRRDILYRHL